MLTYPTTRGIHEEKQGQARTPQAANDEDIGGSSFPSRRLAVAAAGVLILLNLLVMEGRSTRSPEGPGSDFELIQPPVVEPIPVGVSTLPAGTRFAEGPAKDLPSKSAES